MKNEKAVEEKSKKEMAALSKAYLFLYNGIQSVGWSCILFQTVKLLLENKAVDDCWALCGRNLQIFQTLALLEVFHCMFGLVPSSAATTFIQVFSRVFQVWGILSPVKEAQASPALVLTLIAWGVTESIRYSYYCLNLIGSAPKFMTWCRYTFFIGLYPAGVLGESGNVYYALNTLRNKKLFSLALPNRLNFSFNFYYATIALMLTYFPVFPKLYMHMFRQRKKILGGPAQTIAKKVN
ncbi:very-long-chain (3R)-3-hydroxyacyl-CoA dehydratase 2 [Parasteatoda tepidariorum]|uniref:very-long-chain (3R)-3-hydroxyacyl-CoA dehydratase 2 n=1 Tax=Parasteatoda tepidariorum TaxID=114398 RepID=UPI00077F83D2|nr:very-long-chain (3R)-3-hydroxyacyl-CoA dehydratase 2 [Parasteatoda tepidariorum]